MGANSWCAERHGELGSSSNTRDIKKEISLYNKIKGFDWDQYNEDSITIVDKIMLENTDDIGNLLTHETAELLFNEFKKFMFLNYIQKQIMVSMRVDPYRFIDFENDSLKISHGLTAPPYIDNVWTSVLSTKVYYKFWIAIFGSFVERLKPSESNKSEYYNYQQTLMVLDAYEDIISPNFQIWPLYSNRHHLKGIELSSKYLFTFLTGL